MALGLGYSNSKLTSPIRNFPRRRSAPRRKEHQHQRKKEHPGHLQIEKSHSLFNCVALLLERVNTPARWTSSLGCLSRIRTIYNLSSKSLFSLQSQALQSLHVCSPSFGIIPSLFNLSNLYSFESIIHEFDPWFNFRASKHLVNSSFESFWNWFDERSWYPLGRVAGGTLYPGLMVTSAIIYKVLRLISLPVDIRNICVLLAPGFSGLTALATYLFTREMTGDGAGLLAAAFMGIAPGISPKHEIPRLTCVGYISRSVAGSYDNEAIAIFLLMFTFFLWIKALKTGSAFWATLTALFYFYMVAAWGGYVFITNMLPLHAFVLILMGRYSSRLYVAYSTYYAIGTLASMQIPFVGFQPVFTSEHMAALGTRPANQINPRNIRSNPTNRIHPICTISPVIQDLHITPESIPHQCLRSLPCSVNRPYLHRHHSTLDRPLLLVMGHRLRKDTYPNHSFCVGTSTYPLAKLLLRPQLLDL